MIHRLELVEFRDPARARREITALFDELDSATYARLASLVELSADADRALLYLGKFKERHPGEFSRFLTSSATLQYLAAVFSHSRFLSEELLKSPGWIETMERLDQVASAERYAALLREFLDAEPAGMEEALSLARFRRRQILRILVRDVLNLGTISEIAAELSNLADAILEVSYQSIRRQLVDRHGTPLGGMAVIALGKLGGCELNYSSDIDLMFVYAAAGETDGPLPISNKEFYKKVANQFTQLLSTHTAEGLCYRVDLRLRPDGSLGEACISLDGAKKYYGERARDWELQMLIKARVAAGEREVGEELLAAVEPRIYSTTLDFGAVEDVSVTRERIGEKLARKNEARRGSKPILDIKLARGGIRDIEFLVQCLQRLHGGRVPWVRSGGTLLALSRLNDKDLLSGREHAGLASAYRFLRYLEHRLQIEDDRQTHTLPTDPRELDLLARKMPGAQLGGVPSGEKLLAEVSDHLNAVQEIYARVIHAQKPVYYTGTLVPPPPGSATGMAFEPASSNLIRFLDEKAPRLAAQLSQRPFRWGSQTFEAFLEKIVAGPWLPKLNDSAVAAGRLFDIFEHSPYFSDELIRTPDLIEDVMDLESRGRSAVAYGPLMAQAGDAAELRRYFRREMFRLQAASLCLRIPVFETLHRTSDLADAAIAAAYHMAVQTVLETHLPTDPLYPVRDQMMVVALGRLGMQEFDLASDADLIFLLPDQDQPEHLFWTRVANCMIDLIGAYTGGGIIFTVDPRLRPNGSAGALVQSEGAYKDYFARQAEAWEGIAYMKSRAVAGDLERATHFLNDLQELDWRRYGQQSGRSKKDLRQMRGRLEKEQGPDNPLKAGPGGFYDIDFALLYLRLRSAGIFFKVLNMPERIDVIEKMGHLERGDAEFLRDAVTFYRAVDHGLRIYSGHAEGKLPSSETQVQILTEIVRRWTPEHLNRLMLHDQLSQIRVRTRAIFEQLFG